MSSPPHETRPPVVVVTGPTAVGKTELAIELALRFDAAVVNADSMQVYRGMDIGTSKATPEQRARVPHHLLDVVDPDVHYSAGRFANEARQVSDRLLAEGKGVFLTGGTGLYIRAFLEGLLTSGGADEELRGALEREHAEAVQEGDPARLHRRLEECDPEAARRIHPNDLRRIIRTLEIAARSGDPASQLQDAHGFADRPYRSLHLALDPGRKSLDARIDACCRSMIEAGLLQEVRELRERGYGPELRTMQAIGYRHMQPVVEGKGTLEIALEQMQRDTRRFARRQRTWLRGVPEAIWIDPGERDQITKTVEAFLRSD